MESHKKSRKRTVGKSRAMRANRSIIAYERIPSYKQQVTREWKVRYVVSTGGILSIFTVQQAASILGIIATSATTSSCIATSFKLIKIEMWDMPNAIGSPVTVGAKWADNPLATSVGLANLPATVSDTSESLTFYAHCVLKPIPGDVSFNWQRSDGTANYFVLSAGGDAFVDFTFQFIIDDIGTLNSGPTLVGATTGVIYHKIVTGTSGMVLTPVNTLNQI